MRKVFNLREIYNGMKEAEYWKKIGENVRCELCPHFCFIKNGEIGKCGVRQNQNGILFSLVYGKPCSMAIDPIEKKPLYHFLPGNKTLSIATNGCNFKCQHCQNWEISQGKVQGLEIQPKYVVKEAKKSKIISYTYTEPTVFYEYMKDIAQLAKRYKIKNVMVTNGFINPKPLKELLPFIDAINIDVKGNPEFYEMICKGNLRPVLESIKIMQEHKIWIELTYLIIPGLNDSHLDIDRFVSWVEKNLGKNVPIHFTAFYPKYKMLHLPKTTQSKLETARKIGLAKGLNYVYNEINQNTSCPKCKEIVIKRAGFSVIENKLRKGKCFNCKENIAGAWH
jgi:pyruvate formate lyase activating enzyme